MKFKGLDRAGDFDQLQLSGLGQNSWGDFDQMSVQGVDFGANYEEDYKLEPNILKGESTMYGADYQQVGSGYEMGILPEGMSGDFNQMGIVPSGMSGHHQQMGLVPAGLGHSRFQQLGGIMDTLNKPLTTVAGFSITPLILIGVGGALFFAKKQGMLKKFGL